MNLEDLQKFCSKDETRTALLVPFFQGSHTYATDGRILIKVPLIEGTPHVPNAPKIQILEDNIPKEEGIPVEYPPNWQELIPNLLPCHRCNGHGSCIECKNCDGFGEVECNHCGHEAKCVDCKGEGIIASNKKDDSDLCEVCKGTGKIEEMRCISLNRGLMFVNFRYLEKFHSLPDVKAFIFSNEKLKLIHFKFNGGEGVCMPMSNNYRKAEATTKEQWNSNLATA